VLKVFIILGKHQYKYTFFCLISICFTFFIAPSIINGEQEITEVPTQDVTFTPIPTATFFPTETPTNTETPTATVVPTETATATASEMSTPVTVTPIAAITIEGTATETLVADATVESTETLIGEVTPEAEITAAVEVTPEAEITAVVEVTVIATETSTPTPVAMMLLMGSARYQSHVPDNSGIEVSISDDNGNILATASSDAQGYYVVSVPAETFFWLTVSAPLHRRVNLQVAPGGLLPEIILAGGDLDADGCIGAHDVALLTAQFEENGTTSTDITGDGITDDSDLAILAGNFEMTCTGTIEVTATPLPTITSVATLELSATPTAEITEAVETTPETTEEAE
jgi:hypothetical protein